MTNNQLEVYTHKQFFNAPAIQKAFDDVWKGAGKQFTISILSVLQGSPQLKSASNDSIYAAAMKAAVLNLPIEPSLGRAHLVPFKGQAQFQIGYKGLIELAQRTGKYKSINAGPVYKSQLIEYDPLFEELTLDFSQPKDEVVGYFASFSLLNGFRKLTYWTKEEVTAHGKKFSKTFSKGPWQTDFDAMARKTVLKHILSIYGPLSVEMQTAIKDDNEDTTFADKTPKDITPEEPSNLTELLEVAEQPQAIKEAEPVIAETETTDTSYPAEEIPNFDEETGEVHEDISFFEGNTTQIKE